MCSNVSHVRKYFRGAKLAQRQAAFDVKMVGTSKMEHAKDALKSRAANKIDVLMTTAAKSASLDTLNKVNSVANANPPFLAALSVQVTLCVLNVRVNFCK